MFQGGAKPERIGPDLALVDDGLFVGMEKLDRIFHSENMTGALGVDHVDQGGQSGRLPGPGRTGHQDQAALQIGQLPHRWRNTQFLERLDLRGNRPEGRSDGIPLEVHVHAEATPTGNRMGGVQLQRFLQLLPLLLSEDAVDHPP